MLFEKYDEALELCYEAVAFPELWPKALDALSASVGATGAMFYPKDVKENATRVPSSTVYSELLEDYVAGRWYENHYRAERGWPFLLEGRRSVVLEHDLATDEERRRIPHFNELYLRHGFPGFAAIGFWVDGQPWCLPLIRSQRDGFFSREEAAQLTRLQPHLARMMKMAALFEQSRNLSSLESLEKAGHAAILLWRTGTISTMNGAAETLLAANSNWLRVRRGSLVAMERESNRRLAALVRAAVGGRVSLVDNMLAKPVHISRGHKCPLIVEAIAPTCLVRTVTSSAQAILLLKDPEEGRAPDGRKLREAYRLTASEIALCERLAEGLSISDAAEALSITRGTARQRLKAIFQKTGTHRQSELVLLLSRL